MIITGTNGFIGRALHERVLKDGGSVTPIPEPVPAETRLHVESKDTVFVHLGAMAGVPQSIMNPVQCFEDNVQCTVRYLSMLEDPTDWLFILASSGAARQSLHPYGASKAACEEITRAWCKTYGLNAFALRFSNVYGPGSKDKQSVIAEFCRDALTKGIIEVEGDGTQTRDFVYIDDVVDTIKGIVDAWVDVGQNHTGVYRVLSVASFFEHSIMEVATIISDLTGCKITNQPRRHGDVDCSNIKMPDEIPAVTDLRVGIENTLNYFEGIIRHDLRKQSAHA